MAAALATPAHAQWVVTDPALQGSVTGNQLTQIQHMVQEYTQMITQYTAMLTSLGSLQNLGLSTTQNSQMTLITDPGPFVQQACPNATDPVGTVLGVVGLNATSLTSDIKRSQNQICQQITILEIHKYNTVAEILNEMNSYVAALQGIDDKANAIIGAVTNAVGDRQAVNNQTSMAQARFSQRFADVQQKLQADDAAINTLKAQQSILGNIALKGSNSIVGNAMQTVVFAAALNN